jgi:predicted lipoprotein
MFIRNLKLLLLTSTILALTGCTFATVRTLEEDRIAKAGFNAGDYVASIWDTDVLPTMENNAVEINQLLSEIDANQNAAIAAHGKRTSTGPHSFMVRGEAKVLQINRESRVGVAELDLAPYDGSADVYMAIGPVLRGNALRDAVGFIQFSAFTNQVEFAQVSDAMKTRVDQLLLATIDIDGLVDQEIGFLGAFTLEDRSRIVIMPVRIEEAG